MRFIPTNCLRSGQVLASDLVSDKNHVLLRRGIPLTLSLIGKIHQLGFQGVYIDDDISRDIQIESIISDELKFKAKKEIRSLFLSVEHNVPAKTAKQIDAVGKVITDIVDELIYNRDVMINVVDLRTYDDYTFSHSLNVTLLSIVIGSVLGMERSRLHEMATGALVHDIGKVFIDKRIIDKPGRLTAEEYTEVKKHSLMGYNYLASNEFISPDAKTAVLSHHELYDGKGYPAGIMGEDIHPYARIICIADVYDALTSDRPYRPAMLPSDAVEFVMSSYGTMFDPQVVDAFVKKVAPYPIGTCVKLSSGEEAIVIQNFESYCTRPLVRIIRDNKPRTIIST